MELEVWGQTDVGLKREINQDTILVDESLKLFIVADGMGGHKGGEIASAMAVEAVQEVIQNGLQARPKINAEELLTEAFRVASARIHHKSSHENPDLMGMGTTMVGIFLYNGKAYIGNVGDSRAYLYRNEHLWALTEDHSLINEQIRAGVIAERDAHLVVGKNVITRSVGFERDVNVDILTREVIDGDIFMLCSDGLCGYIEDHQISKLCKKDQLKEVVSGCIDDAKKAGGDDNISVIMLKAKLKA